MNLNIKNDEAHELAAKLARLTDRSMTAVFLEVAVYIDVHRDAEASRQLDYFIWRAGIEIMPMTLEQAQIARQAYLFGTGAVPLLVAV